MAVKYENYYCVIVMLEMKPDPRNPKQEVIVKLVSVSEAARYVKMRADFLFQLLRRERKFDNEHATVYTRRGAKDAGKPWREKAN